MATSIIAILLQLLWWVAEGSHIKIAFPETSTMPVTMRLPLSQGTINTYNYFLVFNFLGWQFFLECARELVTDMTATPEKNSTFKLDKKSAREDSICLLENKTRAKISLQPHNAKTTALPISLKDGKQKSWREKKNPKTLLSITLIMELPAQDTSRLNTQRFKRRLDLYMESESIHSYINFHRSKTGPWRSNQNTEVIRKKLPCSSLAKIYPRYIQNINCH